MRPRTLLGTGGAIVVAAFLLSAAPTSCGCETPLMELGWQLAMFTPPDYALPQDMTAENMQRAASKKYIGQRLSSLVPPSATREGECKPVGVSQLNCVYWLETGPLREEGRSIKFFAGIGGNVERVEVSSIQRWFGSLVRDL